ncbi:MAG: hypothetical protein LCI00_10935 [Chloroflexi bacterium]|nr:hypothetical protein [Chloroflexota bacterium]MCC6892045.1 hypothetical protein [Anaerolineae bacterium]
MNSALKNWLDRATDGLPPEIQTRVSTELASHYEDALTDAQRAGLAADAAHERAMTELGNAAETANGLRRTHLRLHRHLAVGITLCLVLAWFLINGRDLIPNAYISGSLRIITGAGMFTLFLGGLWLLRDFLTRQLGLRSLQLPINLQLLGWGLTVIPFFRAVLLARITPLNELLMTEYPIVQHRLFQVMECINLAAMLGVLALMFFRTYLHNAYWLKQRPST